MHADVPYCVIFYTANDHDGEEHLAAVPATNPKIPASHRSFLRPLLASKATITWFESA
jgi:hypothetical protein